VLREFVRTYYETKVKVDEKGTWLTCTECLLMIGVILVGLAFIIEVI
jgi:hypothetical protein